MSGISTAFEHLVVLHSHWRPGGVRRVVELGLPEIVQFAQSGLRQVTVLSGGAADERPNFPTLGIQPRFIVEPTFDYLPAGSPNVAVILQKIREVLAQVIGHGDPRKVVIWFHNPALAKNPLVCVGVREFAAANGVAVVMHHHDFWSAGRWERWETLRACGLETLESAAHATFMAGVRCRHVTVNRADSQSIAPFFSGTVDHLPNPVVRSTAREDNPEVQKWISEFTNGRPLWICPTRLLRRKNLLEAVLLARWLRPEAVLATTSAAFSPDEEAYASAVRGVAEASHGGVVLGLLDGRPHGEVAMLLRAAEAVLSTSVREGFGMSFIEAAAVGTPLIARRLPHVEPDLKALGFSFPHQYDEVWIDPSLIEMRAEINRRQALASRLSNKLRLFGGTNHLAAPCDHGGPVAFSRLTLEGQLEVLSHAASESWKRSAKWNPKLIAMAGAPLKATLWPTRNKDAGESYASKFLKILHSMPDVATDGDPVGAQWQIARVALNESECFPLLL